MWGDRPMTWPSRRPRLLEQNLEAPSDGLPVERLPLLFDEFLKRSRAAGLWSLRQSGPAYRRRGARARRIFEGECGGEADRADEIERGGSKSAAPPPPSRP